MNKQEFLRQLRKGLAGLPQEEREERLLFYSEMLDDRMEEGISEEEAVAAVGPVEQILGKMAGELPPEKEAGSSLPRKKRKSAGQMILLALGAPIWLSLGIAAFAVALSLYVSLWAVIISLWAVFASLAGCFVGGVLAWVVLAAGGNGPSGLAMLAAGLVCAGLGILAFYGCKAVTKGTVVLTKKLAVWLKNRFAGKEAA